MCKLLTLLVCLTWGAWCGVRGVGCVCGVCVVCVVCHVVGGGGGAGAAIRRPAGRYLLCGVRGVRGGGAWGASLTLPPHCPPCGVRMGVDMVLDGVLSSGHARHHTAPPHGTARQGPPEANARHRPTRPQTRGKASQRWQGVA